MFIVLLTCIIICCILSPLGCVTLWQKKSYFADGLAHSALLATSLSAFTGIPIVVTAPMIALIFAVLVFIMKSNLDGNTAINVVSNTMLALGLVIASAMSSSINVTSLLLGEILSVTEGDVYQLCALLVITYIVLFYRLPDIVLASLNVDLAKVYGINTQRLELMLFILLALVLALSMKVVGVLLVGALLIIPSAAARILSSAPYQMIVLSTIISLLSCIFGVWLSFMYDFTTTPTIVLCAGAFYVAAACYRKILLSKH